MSTPIEVAIAAIRELAKDQDYQAKKKQAESAILLREAGVHANLWAALDIKADQLERTLTPDPEQDEP